MKRTRTNAKLLALILALVFAFELLPAHMASAAENISKWPALCLLYTSDAADEL